MPHDEDDGRHDAHSRRLAPPAGHEGPPRVVVVAGYICCAFGGLFLLSRVADFTISKALDIPAAGPQGGVLPLAFGAVIGLMFLSSGVLTVQGKAKNLAGNGVFSLVIGLLCCVVNFPSFLRVLALSSGEEPQPEGYPDWLLPVMLFIGSASVVMGLALMLAGVLMLTGRNAYEAWRTRHSGDDAPGPPVDQIEERRR
jgi:hypothetical protein